MRNIALVAVIVVFGLADPVDARTISGTARVVDGDTLEVNDQSIRLHGIDAPEDGQRCTVPDGRRVDCGDLSTRLLTRLIGRDPVRCVALDRDRYGRVIARCSTRAVPDLNRAMVRNGGAFAFRRYSTEYVDAEELAEAERRVLWQTDVERPWDYRRREPDPLRSGTVESADRRCIPGVRCSQLATCEAAMFQLRVCDRSSLDRDGDGVPCESLCSGR